MEIENTIQAKIFQLEKELNDFQLTWSHFEIPIIRMGYKIDHVIITKNKWESYDPDMIIRDIKSDYRINVDHLELHYFKNSKICKVGVRYESLYDSIIIPHLVHIAKEDCVDEIRKEIRLLQEEEAKELSRKKYGVAIKYS